jgi:hypothetical protein
MACIWLLETRESSLWLWCSTTGQISPRTVLVSFFLIANRGETVIVNLVKAYDQISSAFCLCVIIHVSHVVLCVSDGMNYLLADGANSLRKGCVWWCPRILNPEPCRCGEPLPLPSPKSSSPTPCLALGTATAPSLSHPVLIPNQMLIVCVSSNQVYTHTV